MWPIESAIAHLRQISPRPTRFAGSYPTRAAALESLPDGQRSGYDNEAVAEVSFDQMAQVAEWDYPVLFWLAQLGRPGLRVLDLGGHLGTKYIGFSKHLPLSDWQWTVYDLPAIVRVARAHQAMGKIPAPVRFVDQPAQAGEVDVVLASGLMQYLDQPLGQVLDQLPARPGHVLLNKVAVTDGPTRVTLERIGQARVPYQIRSVTALEAEITAAGYQIADRWTIRALSHKIPTHPWLGESEARGYTLVHHALG